MAMLVFIMIVRRARKWVQCRQVPLCKALHWGTSSSFINILTNQSNEMGSTSLTCTPDSTHLPTFSIYIGKQTDGDVHSVTTGFMEFCSSVGLKPHTVHILYAT